MQFIILFINAILHLIYYSLMFSVNLLAYRNYSFNVIWDGDGFD